MRSSLIRVYTVCHSTKYFKKQLHKSKNLTKKVWNKVFEISGYFLYYLPTYKIIGLNAPPLPRTCIVFLLTVQRHFIYCSFLFSCATGVSCVAFVSSLVVPHLSFIWCHGRAVLRDCGISWVSSLVFSIGSIFWFQLTRLQKLVIL